MASLSSGFDRRELSLAEKARAVPWLLVVLIVAIAGVGVVALYSTADGRMQPWAERHLIRFAIALIPMLAVAVIDTRVWLRGAYWAYAASLLLIVAVDLRGSVGMGARRWIDLGAIQLQPSELMNVALMLALARYFHRLPDEALGRVGALVVPVLLILVPTALVLKEPDLGTAATLLIGGAVVLFLAGVRVRLLLLIALIGAATVPVVWHFLHDYQKSRVYAFLDPDSDPLGAGYHILQSKIALGSGGLFGKGFLLGTQSHLSFLPEKQTDFIFTTLAEEFGFVGSAALLALYALITIYSFAIALRSRNQFGRLLGLGIATNFFLYVFINTAMVMGLLPVVGVPLPLVSYGGTAMVTVMFGFGLLFNVAVHRDLRLNRRGESQPG